MSLFNKQAGKKESAPSGAKKVEQLADRILEAAIELTCHDALDMLTGGGAWDKINSKSQQMNEPIFKRVSSIMGEAQTMSLEDMKAWQQLSIRKLDSAKAIDAWPMMKSKAPLFNVKLPARYGGPKDEKLTGTSVNLLRWSLQNFKFEHKEK